MADTRAPAEPPADVLDYFRSKKLQPGYSWLDVFGQEHAHAFTVAKAVEADLLAAFRATIDDAIKSGLTIEEWKTQLEPKLRALGWWGPRSVVDPETGKRQTVDFSSPRRLQNIFWSNMRAARAAGQWQRAQASKDVLPYLLYVETTADEPRTEHLDYVGTLLPIDHPFWSTHHPPNGWGCKCSVRQVGRAEAKRLGGVSRDPVVQTRVFRNRRSGEEIEVPLGIDPGWHTNPGQSRAAGLGRVLADKLNRIPDMRMRRGAIERIMRSDEFADVIAGNAPRRVALPVAEISPPAAQALKVDNTVVLLSAETGVKQARHPEATAYHYGKLFELLQDAEAIVEQDTVSFIVDVDGEPWRAVVKRTRSRAELYLTSYHRIRDRDIVRLRRRAARRSIGDVE